MRAPYPVLVDPSVKCADAELSPMQIKAIREYGDALIAATPLPAKVGYNEQSRQDPRVREAVTQWLPQPAADPRSTWIYDMAWEVVQQINGQVWRYDLTDFHDQLHYVRYDAPSGHFTWHRDSGDDWRRVQRKLAFSLLLSDPSEYDGGGFQIFDGGERTVKASEAGTFIIFPAWTQHRVLPVTRGERRALIGWAGGPPFR
jgi:hypothetical protein